MNRILIVTTSFEDESRASFVQQNSHYPLGLAYLHSYLESVGDNQVDTYFLNDYKYQECFDIVCKVVAELQPNIVSFQILTSNRVSSFRLIEYLNEAKPDIKIIIGGIHTTVMYKQILEKFPYVIAVLGEGEITFSEIVAGHRLETIDGLAYSENGKITKTRDRDLIDDLDALPFPNHGIFFNSIRTTGCILTSRGCPFSCTFCCLCSISKKRVRFRSVNNVVDEIEHLILNYPSMTNIWIHDDSFFLDNDRLIKICDEIIRRNIKTDFTCSGRMKPVCAEMVKKLEEAGFKHVLFGLESGAAEILKSSKKALSKDDAINTFKLFSNSDIKVTAFLIVGLPGETIATIRETADLIQTLQKIKYSLYDDIGILYVYPGTEVYELAKIKGLITDEYWLTDQMVPFYTAEHPIEELIEYKEILLNHIALNRFFTWEGFKAQKGMLLLFLNDRYMRKNLIKIFLQTISQKIISRENVQRIKGGLGLDRASRKEKIAYIKRMLKF